MISKFNSSSADVQTHKFLGKELDRMHGLDWFDLGARRYDAKVASFTSVDPLCEKYYHISPYAYCAGDPVNMIDPDGKRIFITGNHAKQARSQIQKRVGRSLKLTLNEGGSLSYLKRSGKELDIYSQMVASIIDDPNIDVMLRTMDSYLSSTGKEFYGGAFMGNRVEKGPDGKPTRVIANQEINTKVLSRADTYEHKGTSIMHELTESYEGAKIAWETGKSSPSSDISQEVYKRAHGRATPQPYIRGRYLDSENKVVSDRSQAVKTEIYVKPNIYSYKEKIILTITIP